MKPLYRNIFLLFGVAAICFMLWRFDIDYTMLRQRLPQILFYLPLVVGVWVLVYACNAGAFELIVNSGKHDKHLDYRHAYKLTISGFAYSYITPFGSGGAPYRIMELSSHIGVPRATSSVVLYSMMHILSHFCLWTTGAVLFLLFYIDKMNTTMWTLFGVYFAILVFVVYFFFCGYKNGFIAKFFRALFYIPFVRRPARRFYDSHTESFEQVDRNIAYFHHERRAFYSSLGLEYIGRVINAGEFYFILAAFGAPVTFVDAVLVLAFSSLLGNLLFFFPMQMGAREGGLAIIVRVLGYAGGAGLGVFAGLFTRVRELFWILVGVTLVKVGNKRLMK